MLISFEQAASYINEKKCLHIAGAHHLLSRLPKGNWIGGATEYFMAKEGNTVSNELLFVNEFPYERFEIKSYTTENIHQIAADACSSGFSLVIIPADSAVLREYAQHAADFTDMFMKEVAGWVSLPVTVNGVTGEVYGDKAVALHLEIPKDKVAQINMINIFVQDESAPVITFTQEGFSATTCLVNGEETLLADYIKDNNVDTKLPLIGDYAGNGINISIKSIEGNVVHFLAPVFNGIKYKIAKNIPDYEKEFHNHLTSHKDAETVFSCNCILNFLHGDLEGKKFEVLAGPITYGEIAYQLVNQTLVYVTVEPRS